MLSECLLNCLYVWPNNWITIYNSFMLAAVYVISVHIQILTTECIGILENFSIFSCMKIKPHVVYIKMGHSVTLQWNIFSHSAVWWMLSTDPSIKCSNRNAEKQHYWHFFRSWSMLKSSPHFFVIISKKWVFVEPQITSLEYYCIYFVLCAWEETQALIIRFP